MSLPSTSASAAADLLPAEREAAAAIGLIPRQPPVPRSDPVLDEARRLLKDALATYQRRLKQVYHFVDESKDASRSSCDPVGIRLAGVCAMVAATFVTVFVVAMARSFAPVLLWFALIALVAVAQHFWLWQCRVCRLVAQGGLQLALEKETPTRLLMQPAAQCDADCQGVLLHGHSTRIFWTHLPEDVHWKTARSRLSSRPDYVALPPAGQALALAVGALDEYLAQRRARRDQGQ